MMVDGANEVADGGEHPMRDNYQQIELQLDSVVADKGCRQQDFVRLDCWDRPRDLKGKDIEISYNKLETNYLNLLDMVQERRILFLKTSPVGK